MSTIIPLKKAPLETAEREATQRPAQRKSTSHSAEVIVFPGVRYERTSSAAHKQRSGRPRDWLKLILLD